MESPSNIEVMLHFHCSPEPHPRAEALAVAEAIVRFMNEGLLQHRTGRLTGESSAGFRLEPTARGRAWVQMICSTPMPVMAWKNPVTGEVVE